MTNLRLLFVTSIFIGILCYFVYHTIYGNRGIISMQKLKNKIEETVINLDHIRSDRIELEHKVKLLRPDSLDKDMLEEEARKVLGVAKENEEVIIQERNE
ncbi:MAG: septum formation initiator family protein [Rickettsiaceae bacterium]|nr:septum formation initiator family protein [Rickettsiaceae bacterium]